MEKDNNYSVSNLIFTFHIYLAILVIAVSTMLVFKFCNYHAPPTKEVRPYTLEITAYQERGFDAALREKRENLSYVFSVLLAAGIVFLSMFFSTKYLAPFLNSRKEKHLWLGVILFSILSLFFVAKLIFEFNEQVLLSPEKISMPSALMMTFLGFLISNLIIKYQISQTPKTQRAVKIIFVIVALVLSFFIVSYWIFDDYAVSTDGYSVNFNPVAYPIVQQYLGNELLVNFKSLYGLHPYFMQIFLYIFPATILTLSIAIAALFLVALLSLAYFVFNIIENKLLAFAGFLALIYMQNFAIDGRFVRVGITFQYEAIRLFFPAMLLSFLYFFCQKPSDKKYYFGLIFFALATIWNLDSGIPTFLTLVIAMGYERLKDKFDWKFLLTHLTKSLAIISAVWSTLIFYIKIKYGEFPHLSWIAYGQSAALDFGYAMLPIFAKGAWRIVVLIYVIGLVLSIYNFLTKKHSLQNSAILILTVLGIGLFTYFLGRSHISNIMHCAYPALILLIIFADKFCKNLVTKKFIWPNQLPRIDIVLYSLPLLIISYLSAVLFFELAYNKALKDDFILAKFPHSVQPYWISELNFIKQHIPASDEKVRDDILLLPINDQEYYFSLELRAKSPLNLVNIRHAFYQEDLDLIYSAIKSAEKKWAIFMLPKDDEVFILSPQEIENILKLLNESYSIKAQMPIGQNGRVIIFEKKTLKP